MERLVHHLVRRRAEERPDAEAVVHRDERLPWGALAGRVEAIGAGLAEAGIERGDRVAVWLGPSVSQVAALLGVSAAGGVLVPLHPALKARQVAQACADCGARGLVFEAARSAEAREVLAETTTIEVAARAGRTAGDDPPGVHRLDDWVAAIPGPLPPDRNVSRDVAALLYTSGSTGAPKGVVVSHENLLAGARIVVDYLEIGPADRTLAALPLSFDAGLNQLMTALWTGATVVFPGILHGRAIVRTLAEERITGMGGVPSLWGLVVREDSGLAGRPLPDLRYVSNTGGGLPGAVLSALREALPETKVFLMYGLTEAFRSTYLPPEELDRRPTSIGRAVPDTEIFVVDEDGRRCAPGEVGELVHRGPTVSLGYWGRPEATAEVLRPNPFPAPGRHDGERVCFSGDLVRRDEAGFLYFVGRRDSLIKSLGFRVSRTEVEAILCEHPGVREAAVVGVEDEPRGQRIEAFVIARGGASPTVPDLLAHCAGRSPHYMVPAGVEVVASFPLTSSGKVDYPALRRRAGERAAAGAEAARPAAAEEPAGPTGNDPAAGRSS